MDFKVVVVKLKRDTQLAKVFIRHNSSTFIVIFKTNVTY